MILITVIAFALAALLGAYLDWRFWQEVYGSGLLVSFVAIIVLIASAIIAVRFHRRRVRRAAIVAFAVGLGIIAGQLGGPSREPQIFGDGTMTIHLTSPFVGVATSTALCWNVASGTEFQVANDSNARFDTSGGEVVVSINKGDRWEVLRDVPRKDGVSLTILVTSSNFANYAKPGTWGLQADPTSTLTATFSNAGGSIQFANLVPQTAHDLSGAPMNLAGTIDWTCAPPLN
jgi:MFS family permease